jgi:hypothetical protein
VTRIVTQGPPPLLVLFGHHVALPPPPVFWALAVLDVAATLWAWRRRERWPALAAAVGVSAALVVVGVFSIAPLAAAFALVQLGRLTAFALGAWRARHAPT